MEQLTSILSKKEASLFRRKRRLIWKILLLENSSVVCKTSIIKLLTRPNSLLNHGITLHFYHSNFHNLQFKNLLSITIFRENGYWKKGFLYLTSKKKTGFQLIEVRAYSIFLVQSHLVTLHVHLKITWNLLLLSLWLHEGSKQNTNTSLLGTNWNA